MAKFVLHKDLGNGGAVYRLPSSTIPLTLGKDMCEGPVPQSLEIDIPHLHKPWLEDKAAKKAAALEAKRLKQQQKHEAKEKNRLAREERKKSAAAARAANAPPAA
jgi:hypothetical protein